MRSILGRQREFLVRGIDRLRWMVLGDVADDIGICLHVDGCQA